MLVMLSPCEVDERTPPLTRRMRCSSTVYGQNYHAIIIFAHPRKPSTSHAIFCKRLANYMAPKRSFWKDKQTARNVFSKHFSKGVSTSRRQLVPLLFDNLPHWGEHFDKHFKVDLWLTRFVAQIEYSRP